MVTINGTLTRPDGSPETQSFKVSLVDYGTTRDVLYHSSKPLVVTPDPLTGQFSFDIWNDLSSSNHCYYRVQFESGLNFKIRVPESDEPLQLTSLIVDPLPNGVAQGLLTRLAQLEGISIRPTQLQITGLATSTPVEYTGTEENVSLPVTSISLPVLTAGSGLVVAEYDGSNPVTFEIDPTAVVTSVNGNAGSVVLTKTSLGLGNIVDVDNTNASNLTSGIVNASLIPTLNQSTTGNAATASKLETARLINGVAFDGTADISLTKTSLGLGNVVDVDSTNASNLASGIVDASLIPTLNQSTTGNAATASKLATARLINGVAFDGTGDISLTKADIGLSSVPNLDFTNASNLASGIVDASLIPTLNQSTTGNAATASKLATARLINGVAFDGTADVTQALLTAGTGLLSNSYNGTEAKTFEIDTSLVVTNADSRLTDSREWVASTATQAQAEAGTATTRLAWSPVTVWQAIASWFNNSAFKTKLDTIATGANVNTVDSVSGKTGAVVLTKADVGLPNVPNTDTTNADNIGTGVLSDARLSSNVVLQNTAPLLAGGTKFGRQNSSSEGGELHLHYPENPGSSSSSIWQVDCRGVASAPNFRLITINSSGEAAVHIRVATSGDVEVSSKTNSTSPTSPASIRTEGGISVAGNIHCSNLYAPNIPVDEGSFTPILYNLADNTQPVYGSQFGYWWRTGNDVKFSARVILPTQSGLTPGPCVMGGLPFKRVSAASLIDSIGLLSWNVFSGYETAPMTAGVTGSTTPYVIFFYPIATGGGAQQINFNLLKDGWLRITGNYRTA